MDANDRWCGGTTTAVQVHLLTFFSVLTASEAFSGTHRTVTMPDKCPLTACVVSRSATS